DEAGAQLGRDDPAQGRVPRRVAVVQAGQPRALSLAVRDLRPVAVDERVVVLGYGADVGVAREGPETRPAGLVVPVQRVVFPKLVEDLLGAVVQERVEREQVGLDHHSPLFCDYIITLTAAVQASGSPPPEALAG